MFGAGRELDAFVAAFRIPNLFRDLFAEGALSAAFVSTFSRKLEREGSQPAWHLAALVLNSLLLVVGGVVMLGIIFCPLIVGLVAPGFQAEPGKFELTVFLARILFPFLLFVALAALAMGILNAQNRFGIPALASSFFNLGAIFGGLLFTWLLAPDYLSAIASLLTGGQPVIPTADAETALTGMALGTLLGGALQLLVQTPSLHRVGFRPRAVFGFRDPALLEVLRLMGPAAIGVGAVQVNVVINTIFASNLGDGAISWLNAAFRIMYLPLGMFGVALGTATLPAVARAASRNDFAEFRTRIDESLRLLLFLCIPAAVGLAVVSLPLMAAIYEHGRFGPSDTRAAAAALMAYAAGLTGYAAIKVLAPAFYALQDARTPMRVSLVSIGINLVLNWLAVSVLGFGHIGLAAATAIVATLNACTLWILLQSRMAQEHSTLGRHVAKTTTAAAVMGAVCIAWGEWVLPSPDQFTTALLHLATTIPIGIVIYGLVAVALGIQEARRWSPLS
jgi:putative peptidoglycan lipid II flippase